MPGFQRCGGHVLARRFLMRRFCCGSWAESKFSFGFTTQDSWSCVSSFSFAEIGSFWGDAVRGRTLATVMHLGLGCGVNWRLWFGPLAETAERMTLADCGAVRFLEDKNRGPCGPKICVGYCAWLSVAGWCCCGMGNVRIPEHTFIDVSTL